MDHQVCTNFLQSLYKYLVFAAGLYATESGFHVLKPNLLNSQKECRPFEKPWDWPKSPLMAQILKPEMEPRGDEEV